MKPIVVIGAGPAGCAAALAAQQLGHRVVLVDKAVAGRDKVCGGCLSARALGELGALGLAGLAAEAGGRTTRAVRLSVLGSSLELATPAGIAVSRRVFDRALQETAAAAGVELRLGCEARLGAHPGAVTLDGEALEAEILIVATGLGPLPGLEALLGAMPADAGARLGLGGLGGLNGLEAAAPPPGVISMAVGRDGYVGRVRVEGELLDIAAAVDPAALRGRDRVEILELILTQAGIDEPLPGLLVSGTPKLNRSRSRFAAERLLVVGDAGGYVEPFTGEGISWALASGRAAGELIGGGWNRDLERHWNETERKRRARAQRACAMLSRALRRPQLLRRLLPVLRGIPFVLGPLIRRVQETT